MGFEIQDALMGEPPGGKVSWLEYAVGRAVRNSLTLIQQGFYDTTIIPDKYNTGIPSGVTLTPVTVVGTYGQVPIVDSSGATKFAINFLSSVFQNTTAPVVSEGFDFSASGKSFLTTNPSGIGANEPLVVQFINCKFGEFDASRDMGYITLEFYNCYFTGGSAVNSNMKFYNCRFGDSAADGIRPLRNVLVQDCYFANFSVPSTYTSCHSDGVQVYGYSGIVAENIVFNNCRMEIPSIPISSNIANGTYANGCLMVQMEASNGQNIHFNNCIINGGGYSIYAYAKNAPYTLTASSFNNIKVGCSKRYGTLYPTVSPNVTFVDVVDTDKLYVAKVWTDSTYIHISVTNDTTTNRTLRVVTNLGTTDFIISPCLEYSEMVEDVTTFADFPFDLDRTVVLADWVICYDITDGVPTNKNEHIRFVNFGTDPVYV